MIELGIHQLAVKRSLNRLFGYGVSQSAMVRIKAMAGEIYAETRRIILQKIVRGGLVHVDETRANVRGRTGYVWVFTSLNEVAYLYSDSREGEIAQRTLADFKGVLASDFFSAYDSMSCPKVRPYAKFLASSRDVEIRAFLFQQFRHPARCEAQF